MSARPLLRRAVALVVCKAAVCVAVACAGTEWGWASEPDAPTAGRRAAEALPPGRFRAALLAELNVLDARRPTVRTADGTIIVTPLESEPFDEPPAEAAPAEDWRTEAWLPEEPTAHARSGAAPPEHPPEQKSADDLWETELFVTEPPALEQSATKTAATELPAQGLSAELPVAVAELLVPAAAPAALPGTDAARPVTNASAEEPAPQPSAVVPTPAAPPGWVDPFAEQSEAEADRLAPDPIEPTAAEPTAAAPPTNVVEAEAKVAATDQAAETTAESGGAKTAEPVHTPGFGPHCPVTLRDDLRLAPAQAAHETIYEDVPWHFATSEARAAFLKNPTRYQPVAGGGDVVLGVLEGFRVPGRPDRCAVYQDRLYLFASKKTRAAFAQQPDRYAAAAKRQAAE